MAETFKIGDKVTHPEFTETGEIKYGPYQKAGTYLTGYYLVDFGDSSCRELRGAWLTPVPAFAVGDEVTYVYGGGGKLVAGPFKSEYHGELLWVVEKPNGTHMTPTQNSLTKVEPAPIKPGDRIRVLTDGADGASVRAGDEFTVLSVETDDNSVHVDRGSGRVWWFCAENVEKVTGQAANTFTHDGVTYDLGATYEDRDGDRWKFARIDGEIFGDWGLSRNEITSTSGYSIACAVNQYGPFTKI
ncbi:hypothetical protein HEK616_40620 [Streptomyces nigrescens]|uniref:Uncharacterized protein n=1 Tax=Streptomyces nigrescens TaxID=1920 RepID=A0ABN6QZ39_STRNI|nr:phiSA1p31-related protein [Streptomyces nigrescens]BDM70575.1 hypothetical protein HEK616_40620 [Streptomyces nigrescens]